jgi:hypothetical protein
MASPLLFIDDDLKTTLQKLDDFLGIKLDATVINTIVSEEGRSSASPIIYTLFKKPHALWFDWVIEGIVDEHEPETIWIQSRNGLSKQRQFDTFFESLSSSEIGK